MDSALESVEQSGHWQHYRDDMFIIANDEEPMACEPMNCPAHCLLYKTETRSYRDVPIKMSEYGPLSRFEKSGTLYGALRARGFHQDDAHLLCVRIRSKTRSRMFWRSSI